MSTPGPSSSSHWCYGCSRFVRVRTHPEESSLICSDCNGGFVEEIDRTQISGSMISDALRNRFPAAAMYMGGNGQQNPTPPVLRRARRTTGERSPFNPVIVLRATNQTSPETPSGEPRRGFEMYYNDGAGSGLRPLPASMSQILLGSGFDRLLDQMGHVEVNGLGRMDNNHNPPASKAAIESLPSVEIQETHISTESYCAVCKEPFELGTQSKEMPCKHLYHKDCILPWLTLRNSCPVCRHELPTDTQDSGNRHSNEGNGGGGVGLTIWRLPGGGFAVGRFSGGRRGVDRDIPVVFTEMDGGFNNGAAPRRVQWGARRNGEREVGGFRRVLRNMFSCFGGRGAASSSDGGVSPRSGSSAAAGSTGPSRRRRAWALVVNNGGRRGE